MNNSKSQLSYAQMRSIAASLKTSSNNLKTILNNTKIEMKKVNTSDVWKSDAASELSSQFNSLINKFEGYYTKIMEYSKFIEDTVTAYEDADNKIKNAI